MENQNNIQPQMQQPQYMQPQYMQPVPPQPKDSTPTVLCVISLCLYFLAPVICGVISGIFESGDIESINEAVSVAFTLIYGLSYIGAWVLAIVARVKYKTTFSKVLLILYGVLTGLVIIGFVLLFMACAAICGDCNF